MGRVHDVIVAGAGASGLACAITAGRAGASVLVLEARDRAGRSVLASGNGRCNFLNADLAPARYNDPAFVEAVMGPAPLADVLAFFEGLGLWWTVDGQGRYYPRSRAAQSVLDALHVAAEKAGVNIRCGCAASVVARGDDGSWEVSREDGSVVHGCSLVWACGGGSAAALATCLGLPLVAEEPVLCPLATTPRPPKMLDGVRCNARVGVVRDGRTIFSDAGEVLWRSYGVSGIVVFDASRFACAGDELVLDLFPELDLEGLADRLDQKRDASGKVDLAADLLRGAVHPKLGSTLEGLLKPYVLNGAFDSLGAARVLKNMRYRVVGAADVDHAQVTRGGLANGSWSPATLEAHGNAGLFACGEVLDVDGACGGLNLAWAWKSGMVAGGSAARYALRNGSGGGAQARS